MPLISVRVTEHGPLFRAPVSKVRGAIQGAVQELVELGEQRLNMMLRPRPAGVYLSVEQAQKGKASTGHYRRNLFSKVTNLHGLITDGNVVYSAWLEGVSSRNQTTRFKGYHSFARVAQFLEKNKTKVLQAHVKRFLTEMN